MQVPQFRFVAIGCVHGRRRVSRAGRRNASIVARIVAPGDLGPSSSRIRSRSAPSSQGTRSSTAKPSAGDDVMIFGRTVEAGRARRPMRYRMTLKGRRPLTGVALMPLTLNHFSFASGFADCPGRVRRQRGRGRTRASGGGPSPSCAACMPSAARAALALRRTAARILRTTDASTALPPLPPRPSGRSAASAQRKLELIFTGFSVGGSSVSGLLGSPDWLLSTKLTAHDILILAQRGANRRLSEDHADF